MPSRRSSLFSSVLAFLILFLALPALAGNWGENWDEMVWGLPVSVPSVPAVGLFVLALLTTAVWRLRARKAWHSALAILVVPMLAGVLSSPAHAQVAVPNTFTNGDIADADQINANFDELEGALNTLNCATPDDVVCNPASVSCPAAPACDELGSYLQGQISGAGGGSDVSYLIVLCLNAGGTFNTETSTCSVDVTNSAATIAAAAGSAACAQGGGTWNPATSTCTPAYNCFVGGFCSQAAIDFPPGDFGYTNVYEGDTQLTEPALGAGCSEPGSQGSLWVDALAFYDSIGKIVGSTLTFRIDYMCQ
jgi:hypothetical protein